MNWEEEQDVTFENGLVEDFDNYKIDEHLYKEIPQDVSSTEGRVMLAAIKKSDKLAIRQSARIAHSIRKFNRNSTILSILMIGIILIHLTVIIWR